MLVLSRLKNETTVITIPGGLQIVVTLVEIRGNKCRLGFDADKSITIHRGEVQDAVDREALANQ